MTFHRLRLGLALALVAAPAAAHAQLPNLVPEQGGDAGQPTPDPPRPIPPSRLGREAEAQADRLRDLARLLAVDPEVARIEDQLPELRERLARLTEASSRAARPPVDRRDALDASQEWRRLGASVSTRLARVRSRVTALDEARAELEEWRRRWEATDSVAVAEGAGPELRARVAQARERVTEAAGALGQRLDALVSLEGALADMVLRVEAEVAALREAIDRQRSTLLVRDAPSLWELRADARGTTGIGARVAREVRGVLATLARHPARLLLHLLATALLVWVLTRARRAVAARSEGDAGAAAAARVLAHPVAAALLVGGMLTIWVYPNAPLAVFDLALVLATLPLILLTPTILAPSLARPVIGLAVVNLLARLDSALLGEGTVHRVALLLITALGVAVLGLGLRARAFRQAVLSPRWGNALRLGSQVGLGLLAVGLGANLFGFLSLAELVGEGVPLVIYMAVVLTGFVRALDGLYVLALDGWGRRHLRTVQLHRATLRRAGWRVLQAAAVLTWLAVTVWTFYLYTPVRNALARVLDAGFPLGNLRISVGGIATFLAIAWGAVVLARLISRLMEEDVLGRMDLEQGLAPAFGRLIRYFLILAGIVVALAAVGVELTNLAIVGGALGIGIGFGLQNIVGNFVSGLILAFERPIRIGDLVQLDGLTGVVVRIGIRASVLRTPEAAEIIVPNSDLVSSKVTNWTFTDPIRRLEIGVGVAYGSDVDRVLLLLQGVADGNPDVLKQPKPLALFTGFGDSALTFVLRAWTAKFDNWFVVESDLAVAIHAALAESGVEVPFPQRDLHLKSVSDTARRQLAPDQPDRPPEA